MTSKFPIGDDLFPGHRFLPYPFPAIDLALANANDSSLADDEFLANDSSPADDSLLASGAERMGVSRIHDP